MNKLQQLEKDLTILPLNAYNFIEEYFNNEEENDNAERLEDLFIEYATIKVEGLSNYELREWYKENFITLNDFLNDNNEDLNGLDLYLIIKKAIQWSTEKELFGHEEDIIKLILKIKKIGE